MLPIGSIAALPPLTLTPSATASVRTTSTSFGSLMAHSLAAIQQQQAQAETAVAHAVTGQGSTTQAMVAVTEAQTSLDVATSLRNALMQTGSTLMNFQV